MHREWVCVLLVMGLDDPGLRAAAVAASDPTTALLKL